ncbi:MAG: chorismate mutase [Acidimicrobiia bacterium]|nr:chorismate mutase [Acidimicrobiia bacterium]MBP8179831.1 chorismate mutase [Acidimicrobiia bacterium]
MNIRAIRGATVVDEDSKAEVTAKSQELVRAMIERNSLAHDSIISIFFTATDDVRSEFPATAARAIGLGDVPLMCAREMNVRGSMPLCIRVMMHVETDRAPADIHHVYLGAARALRDDLPE